VIRLAGRQEQSAALLMIDLDHFKELNDTLGHHAGDLLLAQLGPRLRDAIRDADTLARLGGDEFAVLLTQLPDRGAAGRVAQRIQAALDEPFALEGLAVHVDASIGIALFPEHGHDGSSLLQRADVAMYEAKRQRTCWATYDPERDLHSRDKLALVGELRDALREGQLVLHYQPKADLRTGQVTGVEALVRWQHPQRGLLYPDAFLAIAEQAGFMRHLTTYVLDAALAQAATWRDQGRQLTVAVNVSATDLMDARFSAEVEALRARHAVPAEALQLEVTENTIMSDPERALDSLARLSETGVSISLDDYGTGYSSLAYVKRLPIRELKIDRSFVFNMDTDPEDATIVRSTIELANNLNLRVVAEGVETDTNWTTLGEMGAALAQGYLLTKPLPAPELDNWIDDWELRGAPRTPVNT
jgi:diguanylate cyclase (GGDEF)-like protein